MPFQPGNKLATGRPSGAKNVITREILNNFLYILQCYNSPEKIKKDLDEMSPAHRRKALDNIAKYILPTLIKNQNENNGNVKVLVEYIDKQRDTIDVIENDSINVIDVKENLEEN